MIDADSALRTEHARNLVATVGDARNPFRQAGHRQAVFLHRHEHAESAAGLALAFSAVAGTQAYWFCRQYKTHGAALASTSIGCGHVAYSCRCLSVASQTCALPPSANSSIPVTKLESSEPRKSATLAISSGAAMRPIGTVDTMRAMASGGMAAFLSPGSGNCTNGSTRGAYRPQP